MKKSLFGLLLAILPSLALGKDPARFVSLDAEERVWVLDVSGRYACPAAAKMLARDKNLRLVDIMPIPGTDADYKQGCMALLK